MAQQQPNQNPKSQGKEKSYNDADLGANNPIKKEGAEKRDNRDNTDKSSQNLGGQKFRDANVNTNRNDQSAR